MRKISGLGWLGVGAVAAALLVGGAPARATTYTVDVTGGSDSGILNLVVSGTTVTSISGLMDGFTITGLSGYASADQQWSYPTAPYITFGGISFTTNNSGEAFNLGWTGTGTVYGLANSIADPSGGCCGDFPVTLDVTQTSSGGAGATPVPASLPLFMGGLFLIGLLTWRRQNAAGAMPTAWS